MRNAVIYARFSSDKQDEASIDAQVRACREYAAGKGFTVLEVYADEAVSGKTASWKACQRMLRDVDRGTFDTIMIHKYDRVARNLGEQVNLEKRLKDKRVELIAVAQDFGSSVEAKIMGKPIKYSQIYEMLRNEKYIGTYTYTPQEEERREDRRSKPGAIRIENALPQIISRAQ